MLQFEITIDIILVYISDKSNN